MSKKKKKATKKRSAKKKAVKKKNVEKKEDLTNETEKEYPPIQYFEILDFKTIFRWGPWWTLLALCRDPEKETTFLALYKYRKRKNQDGEGYWQKATSFKFNKIEIIPKVLDTIQELTDAWNEAELEEGI